MTKRVADVVMALLLLVLTLPIQVLTAALVAVDLGRPVIFRQLRAARGEGTFQLVKFRSMRHQPAGASLSDEERVTAVGRFLRRTRFDELPQLWLILRGDMAFVGPRPLYPRAHSTSNDDLFDYRRRARPGMTGWAQVNGNTLLSEREKLALDAYYVGHASFGFDLLIVVMTVGVILRGERRNEKALKEALAYADRLDRRG